MADNEQVVVTSAAAIITVVTARRGRRPITSEIKYRISFVPRIADVIYYS